MPTLTNQSNIANDISNNNESTAIYDSGYVLGKHDPECIAAKILLNAKITQLPVNLYQIADSIKMTISEHRDPDDSDDVMGTVKRNQIILNPDYPNQRFALAFILGDIARPDITQDYPNWPSDVTKWLTHIALAILMPKQQFMEKYNSGEPYENIAADFDVTDEDFGHRLDTLNL